MHINENAYPKLNLDQHPGYGFRELKGLQTHCALVDATTTLVSDYGYDQVDIGDTCQRVNISRRAFFSYFDSKDQSIFGNDITSFDTDDGEVFLTQNHQDPIADTLDFVEKKQQSQLLRYKELEATEEFHRMLKGHIRKILHSELRLPTVIISNSGNSTHRAQSAFERCFEINSQSRTHPELSTGHEIALSVDFVREHVLYSSARRDEFATNIPLRDAADVARDPWGRNSDN